VVTVSEMTAQAATGESERGDFRDGEDDRWGLQRGRLGARGQRQSDGVRIEMAKRVARPGPVKLGPF
jgi:hypothetical protein